MFRVLQELEYKPRPILTNNAEITRGTVVYKDPADDKIKALTSGLGEGFIDTPRYYTYANVSYDQLENSFETIAANAKAIYVPTATGTVVATSRATVGNADKGDPFTVTSGVLVKASSGAAYHWAYEGVFTEPTSTPTYVFRRIPASTAPATRTFTYNANTGTGTQTDANSPYYVGKIATAAENEFTPPVGKHFLKWNTLANGSGTDYDPGDEITIAASNITLYAIWEVDE